jgi:hypothetical protein
VGLCEDLSGVLCIVVATWTVTITSYTRGFLPLSSDLKMTS